MVLYRNLWQELCSYSNLELAFKKARKHKTLKPYVIDFEADLENNLLLLRTELLFHCYRPKPLETFILRDPKTRKISKSDFRDRVIHHALCNIIEPIFEKCFIFDSYANRKTKGSLKALERYNYFKKKVTSNFTKNAYVLKADILHYFDEVDHTILLQIIQKKVHDPKVVWLIKRILNNYCNTTGKSMPLGDLTSQFFANVYLNDLDDFAKHKLRAKYYLRYVDDFVILHDSPVVLETWKHEIAIFLSKNLQLSLHPDKTRIILLHRGVEFLGFKIFPHHRILKRRNVRQFCRKANEIFAVYEQKEISYDNVYNFMEGWIAYAKNANTYKLRQNILTEFEARFASNISTKEINRGTPKRIS